MAIAGLLEPWLHHQYGAGTLAQALAKLQGKWDGAQVAQLMKTLPVISQRHGEQLKFDSHGEAVNPGYIFMTKRDGNRLVKEPRMATT